MKFSIKDYLSKCDQIRSKLPIWSHLLKKSLMENLIFLCSEIEDNSKIQKIIQILSQDIQSMALYSKVSNFINSGNLLCALEDSVLTITLPYNQRIT